MKIQIASHSPFLVESHDGRSKNSKMKFSVLKRGLSDFFADDNRNYHIVSEDDDDTG